MTLLWNCEVNQRLSRQCLKHNLDASCDVCADVVTVSWRFKRICSCSKAGTTRHTIVTLWIGGFGQPSNIAFMLGNGSGGNVTNACHHPVHDHCAMTGRIVSKWECWQHCNSIASLQQCSCTVGLHAMAHAQHAGRAPKFVGGKVRGHLQHYQWIALVVIKLIFLQ